jgi:SAM-dependent methyltransferase
LICPLCGGERFRRSHTNVLDYEHGTRGASDFVECEACGLLLQDPPPSPALLRSAYPSDYRPHASGALLGVLQKMQANRLLHLYSRWLPKDRAARLVDLGCGNGQFLSALWRAGYRNLLGVDRKPSAGVREIALVAADLETEFHFPNRYSVIFMNNVLEHFAEPLSMLARCRDALDRDGRIILLTPNTRALAHRVFGRYWSGLHAPRHTELFDRSTLTRAAAKLGFATPKILDVADPAAWALSLQNRARKNRPGVERGTAWYALAALPAGYPLAIAERLLAHGGAIATCLRRE